MARESRAWKQREEREGRSDARGWAMAAPEWEAALIGSCFLEAKHVYRGTSLAQLNPHQPHLSITRPVIHMGYPYPC
ncbi:hypothetical protein BGW80DRAFT_1266072 [Lactifluus volemus]|nr:hypothetical protein BGW80DRAFT_1266072 [Lactifluus volemus]